MKLLLYIFINPFIEQIGLFYIFFLFTIVHFVTNSSEALFYKFKTDWDVTSKNRKKPKFYAKLLFVALYVPYGIHFVRNWKKYLEFEMKKKNI